MKRSPLKRSKPLSAKPERVREWQQKSRKRRKPQPRKRTPVGYEGEYGPAIWKEKTSFVCECCGKHTSNPASHHVTYSQQIRQVPGGLMWDLRNRMILDPECHEKHHNRSRVIPLVALPSSAFEYAADLLGPEKAFEYLRRRYAGEDPRLDALLETTDNADGGTTPS